MKQKSVEDARNYIKSSQNRLDANVQKLLKLNCTAINSDMAEKLVRRAKSKHYIIPEEKPKVDEPSVFTEEDFKNFEKEFYLE